MQGETATVDRISAEKGECFDRFYNRVSGIAKKEQREFDAEHNGIVIRVTPESEPAALIEAWGDELDRRNAEYDRQRAEDMAAGIADINAAKAVRDACIKAVADIDHQLCDSGPEDLCSGALRASRGLLRQILLSGGIDVGAGQ